MVQSLEPRGLGLLCWGLGFMHAVSRSLGFVFKAAGRRGSSAKLSVLGMHTLSCQVSSLKVHAVWQTAVVEFRLTLRG